MKEEQKYFIMSTILFVIIAITVLKIADYKENKLNDNYIVNTNKIDNQYINVNDFGIYLQNKSDKSLYDKQAGNDYPTKGYVLNEDRTTCYDYHGSEVKGQVHQTDDGNIRLETTTSIYCQMYFDIDEEVPVITSMSVNGLDKESKERTDYIYEYSINYSFNWQDTDVVYYCVKEGTDACSDSEWQKTKGAQSINGKMEVSKSDGPKVINAYIRDKAKNESKVVANVSNKTITLDRTAPTINKFSITGSNASGTSISDNSIYTHTSSVTYKIEYNDESVDKYCIGTSTSDCTEWKSGSSPITTNEPRLVTGDGQKKMYAFIKDKAGNVSTGSMGTITLDENNPTASVTFVESTENSITVKISGEDKVGIDTTKMYCRKQGGKDQKADEDGICVIPNLGAGQTYAIEAYVYDLSGRRSDIQSGGYETMSKGYSGTFKGLIEFKPAGLNTTKKLGGLYRFVGGCDAASGGCNHIINNFVCFGTDNPDEDCARRVDSEYMYRIIGIDPGTGDLKLIKNTAIREGSTYRYAWNSLYRPSDCSGEKCEWPNVKIYKRLNGLSNGQNQGDSGNTNLFIDATTANAKYLTTGSKWYNMIKDTDWLYGDIGYDGTKYEPDKTADEVYAIEIGKTPTVTGYDKGKYTWTKTTRAKIGLMNISDYYYSYAKSGNDSSSTNCYSSSAGCSNSWLHLSKNGESGEKSLEWTMSRHGLNSQTVNGGWCVHTNGSVDIRTLHQGLEARPVFYLKSSGAEISSGCGTVSSPFVIS